MGSIRTPSLAFFLVLLMATSALPLVDASESEPMSIEGRIFSVSLDENTSYETSIDVPAQTSYDGFPLDVINETFTSGPPIKFSYRISAENFGTGVRTFEKL